MGFGRTIALLVAALIIVRASIAQASGATANLAVSQDPDVTDCPAPDEIASSVDRMVGRHVIDASATSTAPATIHLHIRREHEGILASVRVSGAGSGRRELHATKEQGCEGLAHALPLTLALIIDVVDVQIERARRASLISKEQGTPRSPPPATAWKPMAEAGLLAAYGVVRSTAPAMWAGLGMQSPGGHSVGVGAFWVPSQAFDYAPGQVGVSVWAVTGQGCASLARSSALGLVGCAGPMVGQVRGYGSGFSSDGEASRTWAAMEAEFGLRGAIWGPLQWAVRGGGLATVTSHGFTVEGVGTAHDPQRFALFAGGGLRMSIW